MLEITSFKKEVAAQLDKMCAENDYLFEVNLDKDKLWETYLETIPSEDNQIYKTRREFDCSAKEHQDSFPPPVSISILDIILGNNCNFTDHLKYVNAIQYRDIFTVD